MAGNTHFSSFLGRGGDRSDPIQVSIEQSPNGVATGVEHTQNALILKNLSPISLHPHRNSLVHFPYKVRLVPEIGMLLSSFQGGNTSFTILQNALIGPQAHELSVIFVSLTDDIVIIPPGTPVAQLVPFRVPPLDTILSAPIETMQTSFLKLDLN